MESNASLSVVLKGWREGARLAKSIYQPFVGTVGRFPPVSPRHCVSAFFFPPVRRSVLRVPCTRIQFPVAVHPQEFIASYANLAKGRQTFTSGFRRSACIFISTQYMYICMILQSSNNIVSIYSNSGSLKAKLRHDVAQQPIKP